MLRGGKSSPTTSGFGSVVQGTPSVSGSAISVWLTPGSVVVSTTT
jgi:hypothetical protein